MNVLFVCDTKICKSIQQIVKAKYPETVFEHVEDTKLAYKRILKNHFDLLIVDSSMSGQISADALLNAAYNVGKKALYISDKLNLFRFFNNKLLNRCQITDLTDIDSKHKFLQCYEKMLEIPNINVHQMTKQLIKKLT